MKLSTFNKLGLIINLTHIIERIGYTKIESERHTHYAQHKWGVRIHGILGILSTYGLYPYVMDEKKIPNSKILKLLSLNTSLFCLAGYSILGTLPGQKRLMPLFYFVTLSLILHYSFQLFKNQNSKNVQYLFALLTIAAYVRGWLIMLENLNLFPNSVYDVSSILSGLIVFTQLWGSEMYFVMFALILFYSLGLRSLSILLGKELKTNQFGYFASSSIVLSKYNQSYNLINYFHTPNSTLIFGKESGEDIETNYTIYPFRT